MQGELYTDRPYGQPGHDEFSVEKLLAERAEYFVFNGAVGALTSEHPLKAKVGETVRIFFGVGGPNATSSFHVIGEIFDRVYSQAAVGSPAATNVQTTTVAPGGATIVEFKLEVPGRYILVDHALSRLERGLAGFLIVDGDDNPAIFHGNGRGRRGALDGGGSDGSIREYRTNRRGGGGSDHAGIRIGGQVVAGSRSGATGDGAVRLVSCHHGVAGRNAPLATALTASFRDGGRQHLLLALSSRSS